MATGTDVYSFCFDNPGCAPFFAAGCPDALVRPDGATVSIAPVDGSLWGRTLTFGWSDAMMPVYDAMAPTTGNLTPYGAAINLFLVDSCKMPPGFPQMILNSRPENRSRAYTVPHGTRWVIAWSMPGTADVKWWAQ